VERVRRTALSDVPARPRRIGRRTPRACLGRERGSLHPERPRHRRHPPPQTHPGRRTARPGNRHRPRLPPSGRDMKLKPPPWAQTIRFRLTLTYSAVLIALSALLLGGLYFALDAFLNPKPLDPITVNKVYKDSHGDIKLKPGQVIQA